MRATRAKPASPLGENAFFRNQSGKVGKRTLIDREGSDADQSVLLVALLEESGVSAEIIYSPPADSGDDAPYALPLLDEVLYFL